MSVGIPKKKMTLLHLLAYLSGLTPAFTDMIHYWEGPLFFFPCSLHSPLVYDESLSSQKKLPKENLALTVENLFSQIIAIISRQGEKTNIPLELLESKNADNSS